MLNYFIIITENPLKVYCCAIPKAYMMYCVGCNIWYHKLRMVNSLNKGSVDWALNSMKRLLFERIFCRLGC